MEQNSKENLTKRSLDDKRLNTSGETKEKRPRLESGISDISDITRDDITSRNNSDIEDGDANTTEVIYELSPDHNESSLSISASPSIQDISPKERKSPAEEKVRETEALSEDECSEEENDEEKQAKNEKEAECDEQSEEEGSSSSSSNESSSNNSSSEADSDEEEQASEDEETTEKTKIIINKPEVEMLTDDDAELPDEKTGKPEKLKKIEEKAKVRREEANNSDISDDDVVAGEKSRDATDGGASRKDYSKKSVEDLEYLQEDIHKELAQITGESLQRKKHKKTSVSSSSTHRDQKHHKGTSHHKERERARDHAREHYRHENTETRRKYREESSRGRESSSKHRSDSRQRHERAGKSSPPGSYKRVVTVTKRPEAPQGAENGGKKKGLLSDSMREMIRAGVKEIKAPKDMRGMSTEVVDYDSDNSDPEHNILGDAIIGEGKTSDVSPAESEEDEEGPGKTEAEKSPIVPKLPPYLPGVRGCRNVEEFQWLNRIEEGTYGVVYRAKDKRTGEVVALKKLKMEKEKEGFPITSLREINTLLKSQHPNIVTVQEIVVGSNMDKIYIVMDFVEHDLKALMETMTQSFLAGEIKTIMIQLLRAVNHLHDNWILHRDIKTSNLLLSNKGILKVGDFGLAREYGSPLKPYTPIVVTLWYRAPELLLGAKEYSTPIDMWSVGCVFAELLTMKPLFNGQSEISQINKIFKELGTPSDKIWPGPPAYSELPATKKMTFAEYPYNNLRNKFGATLTDNGFDLLNSFLTYDPKRRITADAALKHQYFNESPSPVDPSMFPSWPARSEGAKRAKKASPKAPEGGNFYKTLSGDGDGAFHMPAGKSQGSTAVSTFTLKF